MNGWPARRPRRRGPGRHPVRYVFAKSKTIKTHCMQSYHSSAVSIYFFATGQGPLVGPGPTGRTPPPPCRLLLNNLGVGGRGVSCVSGKLAVNDGNKGDFFWNLWSLAGGSPPHAIAHRPRGGGVTGKAVSHFWETTSSRGQAQSQCLMGGGSPWGRQHPHHQDEVLQAHLPLLRLPDGAGVPRPAGHPLPGPPRLPLPQPEGLRCGHLCRGRCQCDEHVWNSGQATWLLGTAATTEWKEYCWISVSLSPAQMEGCRYFFWGHGVEF